MDRPQDDTAEGVLDRTSRSPQEVDQDLAASLVSLGRKPHVVLGFKLRPFSFWHAALFEFFQSPFAGFSGKMDVAALYVSARICQMRFPHTPRRGLLDNRARELYCAWRYPLIRRRRNASPASDFIREVNKLSTYLRDYNSRPTYGSSPDGQPIKCPWYLYETACLRRFNPGMTWGEAFDMPIGFGSWSNAATAEANGCNVTLLTPQDRIAMAEAAKDDRSYFDPATNSWKVKD